VEGYRVGEGRESKCRRRVVRNIGPLSRFDDGKPDYLKRLRQSFKEGKPIIESLNDLVENKPIRKRVVVEYDMDNEDDCVCNPKT